MKNVAGYDLSRLQAGAWGTLGLLLSISVRLLPMPEAEETRALECTAQASQQLARRWARSSLPVSATGYWQGTLYLRLSGSASSLRKAAAELGGESTPDSTIWQRLRDRTLPWFAQRPGSVLWELLCPPATTLPVGECAIEWAGARRWWRTNLPSHEVHADAVRIGARAVRPDAPPLLDGLMSGRLKCAFDPDNVLNSHILSSPAESSHV